MTLDGGSSLSKSTGEEGSDDGEGGAIDFANPDGGGEALDGVGNGSGVGHALDEDGDERLDVGVGEDMAEGDSSVEGALGDLREEGGESAPCWREPKFRPNVDQTHLRLGVPHGSRQTGNVVTEALGNLVLGGGGKGGEELESSDLGTPLGASLDNEEELLDNLGCEFRRGEANELLGGLLCGVLDDFGLARLLVAVEDDGEEGDEEGVGAAGEANLAEERLERDHGALTLVGILALGRAGEVLEDAKDGEGPEARLEDKLGEVGRGGSARGGGGGGVKVLQDSGSGAFGGAPAF